MAVAWILWRFRAMHQIKLERGTHRAEKPE